MKKLLFTIYVLTSLVTTSQTFDFKTSQSENSWTNSGGSNGVSIVPAGLEISWIGNKKPKITHASPAVNATTNKIMAITLINNSSEATELQVFHDNGTDTRFYLYPSSIETSVSTPTTYLVDLTNAKWTGTMSQIDIAFRGAGNVNLVNPSSAGSIIIQKIDFIPAEAIKDTYLFNSGTNKEGWIADNAVSNDVSSGVMTLVPTVNSSSKIIQDEFKLDPTTQSHIHITYKNESADNNQIRIQWILSEGPTVRKGANISISSNMSSYETITYDLTGNKGTDWTTALSTAFQIIIRDTNNGNNASSGNLLIQSIVFNNSATPPNIFTSETDSDWATATNWSLNEVPTTGSTDPVNDVVTIPTNTNNVIISGTTGAEVTNLTVDSAGTLAVSSGGSLIVSGTATGNVTYNRNITTPTPTGTPAVDNLEGWHLMSSPVNGQAYGGATTWFTDNGIASGTGANRGVATYNNTVASNNWVYSTGTAATFNTGTGYSVKRTATGDVSFTGTLNTANITDVTISTQSGASGTDFNLIGNPFTAYVNAKTFLEFAANTALLDSETIWVWNPSSKNYDAKLSGDVTPFKIAPGQAFFVKAKAATGNGDLTFQTSSLTHETDTFLKSSNIEIVLNIFDGELKRYAKVRYQNQGTLGFDNGYDGKTFSGVANNLDIYTHLLHNNDGTKYQIQSIPNSDFENMVIPVGITSKNDGEITFSAQNLNIPDGYNVYLEDRSKNSFILLNDANQTYKVNLTQGNTDGRFFLHTKTSNVLNTDSELLNTVSIYKTNNSNLRITGLQKGKATVSLFNLLGKKVMTTSFDGANVNTISLSNLATGVYIAKLQTEAGKLNKKIILE